MYILWVLQIKRLTKKQNYIHILNKIPDAVKTIGCFLSLDLGFWGFCKNAF